MSRKVLDVILVLSSLFFVVSDIVLSLGLMFILPKYLTRPGWYPANNQKVTFEKARLWCSCVHKFYPNGTKNLIHFKKIGYMRHAGPVPIEERILSMKVIELPEETPIQKLQRYPFLASVTYPARSGKAHEFGCNALFVENLGAVIRSDCLKKNGLNEMVIRSNSPYVFKGGNTHRYVAHEKWKKQEMEAHKYLYILNCTPSTVAGQKILPKIDFKFNGKWDYAQSIGWNSNFTKKPFEVETWTTKNVPKDVKKICSNYDNAIGKFYLTNCTKLLWSNITDAGFCKKFSAVKLGYVPKEAECSK